MESEIENYDDSIQEAMERVEEVIVKNERSGSEEGTEQQEVVIILPHESCFEYEEAKKPRIESNKISWPRAHIYELINEYITNRDELENPTTTKSVVWDRVAEVLNDKFDVALTGDMCSTKWRSLKSSYRKVRFSQRPESSKAKWEFYNILDDIYKDMRLAPPINKEPARIDHSQVRIIQIPPANNSNATFPTTVTPEPMTVNSECPVWLEEFLAAYRQNEMTKLKLLQQIHNDILKCSERQCTLLEKLLTQSKK